MHDKPSLADLRIKIFADGAELEQIRSLAALPHISGFTTNPTLMRKAGIADYEGFARAVLAVVTDRPVSFEVFADDPESMLAQARVIASWGANVNVKIPVTTTRGEFCGRVIETLSREGVTLNVTAIMTTEQVAQVARLLAPQTPAIVSVFAGRIADTGRDPVPLMREACTILADRPKAELLWASPRELLNLFHADAVGCHIITVTQDLLSKLSLLAKDLGEYSLETVRMFHRDATSAGYAIGTPAHV
ncbi:MAG: transaldolase [Rhodospirillales bacterium]|jgi:transaldolase|nr:transaldolase [Rhodospirillales bacterium]